jgi:hypothetical protein
MQNQSNRTLTDKLEKATQRWKMQVAGFRVERIKCKKVKYQESAIALMDVMARKHTFQL